MAVLDKSSHVYRVYWAFGLGKSRQADGDGQSWNAGQGLLCPGLSRQMRGQLGQAVDVGPRCVAAAGAAQGRPTLPALRIDVPLSCVGKRVAATGQTPAFEGWGRGACTPRQHARMRTQTAATIRA